MRVLAGAAGLEVPPVAATAVEEEDDDEEEHEEEEEDEREASPPPSPSDQAETLARVGSELSSKNAWQARCCLLLWLAHASAVPFPMALLDASFEEAAGGGAEAGDGGGESDGGSAEEGGREGGTAAAAAATSSPSWPPLAAAAQAAAAASLRSPGADRDSAVLALGRLLSRPDASGKPLKSFVLWACSQVAHASSSNPHPSSSSSSLAALGCVEALAQLFARAERAALAEVGPVAWQAAAALLLPPSLSSPEQRKSDSSSSSSHAMPGVHARRAAAKLASRIAMAVMPPPLARVSQQPFPSSSSSEVSSFPQQQQQSPAPPLSPAAAATAEAVVNALLVALRDRDTAVRWAAAKGISRLAARLPAKRDASELLRRCAGPLITGSDAADDAAWHGSALALASLARAAASAACGGGSGGGNTSSSCSPLLSTRRDARVAARGAAAALSYEFRRGERSVGSHVRDAGAYVTWALARCAAVVGGKGGDGGGEGETDDDDENDLPLTTSSLARALRPLGPLLLSVSCFDREVNCRRAAAAAFQEGAGRLPPEARKKRKGTKEGAGARTSDGAGDAANEEEEEAEAEAETGGAFARSLDAVRVGAADFFTLGSRSRATLSAGPAAARLHPSYAAAAVQALVGKVGRGTAGSKTTTTSSSNGSGKLWHWERATRELSARALARVLRSAVESGWCEEEEEKEEEGKAEGNGKKNPLCPSPSSVAALLLEKCGVASAASPSSCEPEEKHGALCALTELLGEFKEEEWKKKDSGNDGGGNDGGEGETSISSPSSATVSFLPLDDATLAATATLPLSFSKLVRGRGGEMVREAAMRLVAAGARRRRASTAAPSAPLLPPDAAAAALAAVDECLRHPSQAVRSSAAEALSCLATAASSSSSFSSDSILLGLISEALPRWVRWLANDGISSSGGGGAARAGGAAALGALFGSGSSEADKNDNGSPLLHVLLLPAAPDALRALQRACRLEPDPANRDAEARAAAARALPVVAARVATAAADSSSSSSSPFSSSSSSPFSSWCLPDSIRALLDASSDYSTDRRGDVGSWVRGPATRGATELSLLLLLLSLSRAGGEEREEAKRLTPLVAGALARQASERCGRLRGEARSSLRSLLKAREFLPDAAALAEAVRAADEVHSSSVAAAAPLPNGGAEGDEGEGDGGENEEEEHHHHHHHHSHHHHGGSGDDATLALATVLLRIPSYAPEAAAGLAACAGGLDAPLARAAGRALCSAAAAAGSAVAAGTATASSSSDVARALVSAWSSALARGEEARLGTPFLKAADALLSGIGEGGGGGKDEGEALCAPSSESSASDVSAPPSSDSPSPPPPSVSQAMLDLTLRACRRCRDPARLCAASALLCHLAGLDGRRGGGGREKASKAAATAVVDNRTTAARALRAAASLTGHSYPTVRRAAAENLSLRLLMGAPVVYDDEEEGEESERAREAVWRESGKAFEKEEGEEESESRQRRKPDAAAASDLLSETAWDGPTSAARAARARLLELLCLPPPGGDAAAEEATAERAAEAQRRRRCEMGGGGVSAATAATGTASGYQSLVDAVSRGGAD